MDELRNATSTACQKWYLHVNEFKYAERGVLKERWQNSEAIFFMEVGMSLLAVPITLQGYIHNRRREALENASTPLPHAAVHIILAAYSIYFVSFFYVVLRSS